MMKTALIKISTMLIFALVTLSTAAQNFNQYMANEPQAQQPALKSTDIRQPMAKDPSAQQPTASVKDYKRTATTVTVNSAAYQVAQPQTNYNASPLSTTSRRSTVLGGGSATGSANSNGGSISNGLGTSSTSGVATYAGGRWSKRITTTPTADSKNGLQSFREDGKNLPMITNMIPGIRLASEDEEEDEDEDVKPDTGNSQDYPFANGETPIPMGDATLPLLMLLLGYAAFRSIRKKEENA